jgi:hypothetical protein
MQAPHGECSHGENISYEVLHMFSDLKLMADILARARKWVPYGSHAELLESARVHRFYGEYGLARFHVAQARALRMREQGRV